MRRRVVTLVVCALGATTALAANPLPTLASSSVAAPPNAFEPPVKKPRPLVIVLDTSGSMSEDDGTGTIKLAGAQAALSEVIRRQRPGANIGLWTYPGAGDCDPGSFSIPVSEVDQRKMINTIKGLSATGETPTGGALRAAVDELTADGYDGATILLVSDGLSTCDPDPCQVAQDITAEGFDLTVQAAGFQISDEGMAELECIAQSTGGSTYEAADADQLDQVISDATTAELTMTVSGIPARTPAGSATKVVVTVTNESATDIQNARVSINFANRKLGRRSVVPAALPPLYGMGLLKSGQSATHEWVVSYGTQGKTGTAAYRISAWGTNAQPKTVTGVVLVTDANQTLADAGGLIAGLQGKRIAIMGDSYSSGEGAGSYMAGTDEGRNLLSDENNCHKSPYTYLYPLFGQSNVELLACSGATTHYLKDKRNGVREEQIPLLRERQSAAGPVDAVFMTVGGNDIDFATLVGSCVMWGNCANDENLVRHTNMLLGSLPGELIPTYREIYNTLNSRSAVKARGGKVAPIYVLAYPQPFPEVQWAYWCANALRPVQTVKGFEADEIAFANDLLDRLNATIESSVSRVHREGYRVQMVTTTQEAFLPDNTTCPRPGATEYMNSVDLASGAPAKAWDTVSGAKTLVRFMHPNKDGYRAETNTILSWSQTADDGLPEGKTQWREGNRDTWVSDMVESAMHALTPKLPAAGPAVLDAALGQWTTDPTNLRASQSLEVEVNNAAPGTSVVVSVASEIKVLGTIEIGEDGTGRGTVKVPYGVPAGTHLLQALAFGSDGAPTVAIQQIDVARAIPFWLVPLASVVALCLIGSLVLRRRARRTA